MACAVGGARCPVTADELIKLRTRHRSVRQDVGASHVQHRASSDVGTRVPQAPGTRVARDACEQKAIEMKHEYLYRWRLKGDAPAETFTHCTFEDVRRDFPECTPEPLPETLQVYKL